MYKMIFDSQIDVNDYIKVRDTTNFVKYSIADTIISLKNSLFCVVVYVNDEPVGTARIVGDGKTAFFLKDIIVVPEYQSNGVGKLLMESIFNYLNDNAADQAYVGLMSTKGKESYYEKFGFIARPNNDFGSGMILFYDKK